MNREIPRASRRGRSPRRRRWTRRLASGLVAVLAFAACDGGTDPALDYDPSLTLDQLDEVLAALDAGDLLQGLDLAVATLDYYGSAALAAAVSTPVRDGSLLEGLRAKELRAELQAADRTGGVPEADEAADAGLAGGALATPAALSLPPSFVGRVLSWDPVEGYVISGLTGAPATGIRFLLYRMDSSSGYPSQPLVEVGYLDLMDEDGALREGVRVILVRTAGPDRVIADYTVRLGGSWSGGEGVMEVTTAGSIGTSAIGLELEQRLSWSEAADRDELALAYAYRQGGNRSVTLVARAESRYEALGWDTFDFDMTFRGSGPRVEVTAEIGSSGRVEGEILQEGKRAVEIRGMDAHPTFERAGGRSLTSWERTTLELLWSGIGDLIWLTEWLVVPADLLVQDG